MVFFPKSANFILSSNLVFASSRVLLGLINPVLQRLQDFQYCCAFHNQCYKRREETEYYYFVSVSPGSPELLSCFLLCQFLKLAKVVFPNAARDPIFFPSLWRNLNVFCIINALIHIHPRYYYKMLMSVLSKNKTPLHRASHTYR